MSSVSVVSEAADSWWEDVVPGEVIDGLTDGVALRDDAVARAEVVAGIVREIAEAVQWRCADRAAAGEFESLRRLVSAAEAHRELMRSAPDLVAVPRVLSTAGPDGGLPR